MKLRTGDECRIVFDDHVEDSDTPLRFIVWGRVRKVGRSSITVDSWAFENPDDENNTDHNVKRFTIVKRAIVSADRMVIERATDG